MYEGITVTDRYAGINPERMRAYRVARTKEYMAKFGIGTIIAFDAWDIRYLTGAYVTTPVRWIEQQFAILPRNGDPYASISFSFDQAKVEENMPWMKGRIIPRPGNSRLSFTVESLDPFMDVVCKILDDHGLTNEVVGLDGTASALLYQEAFRRRGIKAVDAKECMFYARAIKNEDEIACMRQACIIAEAAFTDMARAIRPGIRENELMGIGMNRLYAMGCDETLEFVVASGPRTNPMHIDFTDRVIRSGDLVAIDINAASFNGYKTCYYRTFCCGKSTQEQRDVYEEARAMMYESMKYIKAGNTTKDVAKGWPQSPQYWGYDEWKKTSGLALAHGIGLTLHEFPMFRPQTELGEPTAVLEEGMVLAVETWAGSKKRDTFGVRLEECVVVTKDGYELLTKYPVDELIECPLI